MYYKFNTNNLILLQGMPGPCVTILIANWSPKSERGFLFSITQTAHSLGPAIGNIFAGYVSELPGGWSYVFYAVGKSIVIKKTSFSFYVFVKLCTKCISKVITITILFVNWQCGNELRIKLQWVWCTLLSSTRIYRKIV